MVQHATQLKSNESFLTDFQNHLHHCQVVNMVYNHRTSTTHVSPQQVCPPTLFLDHEWEDMRYTTKTATEPGSRSQSIDLARLFRQHCPDHKLPDTDTVHEVQGHYHVSNVPTHMQRSDLHQITAAQSHAWRTGPVRFWRLTNHPRNNYCTYSTNHLLSYFVFSPSSVFLLQFSSAQTLHRSITFIVVRPTTTPFFRVYAFQ